MNQFPGPPGAPNWARLPVEVKAVVAASAGLRAAAALATSHRELRPVLRVISSSPELLLHAILVDHGPRVQPSLMFPWLVERAPWMRAAGASQQTILLVALRLLAYADADAAASDVIEALAAAVRRRRLLSDDAALAAKLIQLGWPGVLAHTLQPLLDTAGRCEVRAICLLRNIPDDGQEEQPEQLKQQQTGRKGGETGEADEAPQDWEEYAVHDAGAAALACCLASCFVGRVRAAQAGGQGVGAQRLHHLAILLMGMCRRDPWEQPVVALALVSDGRFLDAVEAAAPGLLVRALAAVCETGHDDVALVAVAQRPLLALPVLDWLGQCQEAYTYQLAGGRRPRDHEVRWGDDRVERVAFQVADLLMCGHVEQQPQQTYLADTLLAACSCPRQAVRRALLRHGPYLEGAMGQLPAVYKTAPGGVERLGAALLACPELLQAAIRDAPPKALGCVLAALCWRGHLQQVQRLLAHPGLIAAVATHAPRWVLEAFKEACAQGHAAVVAALLAHDGYVDALVAYEPDVAHLPRGAGAGLMFASLNGHLATVAALLEHPRLRPAMIAAARLVEGGGNVGAAVECAAAMGHDEVLEVLLGDPEVLGFVTVHGAVELQQALVAAAEAGHVGCVRLLAGNGHVMRALLQNWAGAGGGGDEEDDGLLTLAQLVRVFEVACEVGCMPAVRLMLAHDGFMAAARGAVGTVPQLVAALVCAHGAGHAAEVEALIDWLENL